MILFFLLSSDKHIDFVDLRVQEKGPLKHSSNWYDFSVMTSQERELNF